MANKYIKKYSMSLTSGRYKIKFTSYLLELLLLNKANKQKHMLDITWRNYNPQCTFAQNAKWYSCFRKQYSDS